MKNITDVKLIPRTDHPNIFWSLHFRVDGEQKTLECFIPFGRDRKTLSDRVSGWGTNIGNEGYGYSPFDGWTREFIELFNAAVMEFIGQQKDTVNLSYLYFPGDITLSGIKMPNVHLDSSFFQGKAIFRETEFLGAFFSPKTMFNDEADFYNCKFCKYVNFSGCEFFSHAFFSNSKFLANLTFNSSRFHRGASFAGGIVESEADFQCLNVHGQLNFWSFKAKKQILFSHSDFHGEALFHNISIDGVSGFNNVNFKQLTYFNGSLFNDDAVFFNSKFIATVDFSLSKFNKKIIFDSCKFDEAVDFHDAEFKYISFDQQSNYRILRNKMEALGNRHAMGLFFSLEERCKRKLPKFQGSRLGRFHKNLSHLSFSTVSLLYDSFSWYGMSIWRPFFWFCSINIAFSVYYFYKVPEIEGRFRAALLYSWQQVIKPFNVSIHHNSNDLSLIWMTTSAQSLLSLTLFSLFIIGLRWQFKQK